MSCRWISVKEAAARLGVHVTSVRKWALEGKLEYFQVEPRAPMRICADLNKMQRKAQEQIAKDLAAGGPEMHIEVEGGD